MLFITGSLFALAAAASVVLAQNTTSSTVTGSAAPPINTNGLQKCVIPCWTSAAMAAGCNGVTDFRCTCPSTVFNNAALQCLQTNCTESANAIADATRLQQAECASVSATVPDMTAKPTIPLSTTSGSASATEASGGATTSKSAADTTFAFGLNGVVGAGITAFLGAVAGTLVVL